MSVLDIAGAPDPDQVKAEAALAVDEGVAHTFTPPDSIYNAIARRSIRMARATDENPNLASVLHKVALGFLRWCQVHGISEHEYRKVDVDAFLTGDGKIVISLRHK